MTAAQIEAEIAALEDELCTRSLSAFIARAWPLIEPGQPYVHGWHIDAIAEHLEAVTASQIQKLLITMPPRHMKSLAVSVFWPAWVWLTKPSWRGVFTSYALQLAIRDSVKCRQVIESPWYQQRWGNVFSLTGDQNEKKRFANSEHGERMTGSVDSGVTGEGGDVIVCDDPHNVREAFSDAARQAVIDWWDQVIPTRLNNPETGGRVVVMQRVHEQDLAGHWLAKGGVVHLNLPAEFEPERKCTTVLGWTDPRTTSNELLWPDRFPRPALEELKTDLGPYGTAGQLQQRPSPAEGGMLKRHWWQYYDARAGYPAFDTVLISVDPALRAKETNDPMAIGAWGKAGPNLYGLRVESDQVTTPELIDKIKALHAWLREKFPSLVPAVVVENTAAGPDVIAELKTKIAGVSAEDPKGDKVQRAHAQVPLLAAGNVFLPGVARADGKGVDEHHPATESWVAAFIDECASFPVGVCDNQVDMWSQAMKRLNRPKVGAVVTNIPGL